MKKPGSRTRGLRLGLAVILAVLFLASTLPSTGRVVVDQSTTPPKTRIEGQFQQAAVLMLMMVIPLTGIFYGAWSGRALELLGWLALIGIIAWLSFERHQMFKRLEERFKKPKKTPQQQRVSFFPSGVPAVLLEHLDSKHGVTRPPWLSLLQ